MSSTTKSPVTHHIAEHAHPTRRIRTGPRTILLNFAALTLPMLFLSALLLGLIYRHRTTHGAAVSDALAGGDGGVGVDEPGVVYVRISSTTLVTVASWSSTLAPALTGCLVALVSFPAARNLWDAARTQDPGSAASGLPTPWQLALMVRMVVNAGPATLLHWARYFFGCRGRSPQVGAMKKTTGLLFLGIGLR